LSNLPNFSELKQGDIRSKFLGIVKLLFNRIKPHETKLKVSSHETEQLLDLLATRQLGVGICGGVEAIIHAARAA